MTRRIHRLSPFLLVSALVLSGCFARPPATVKPEQYVAYQLERPVEITELGTPDGLSLFGQWWKPAGGVKAVLLLQHGTAAHTGAYAPWADYATAHGYAVFGYDMRGWGQSQGFGRRGYARGWEEYVQDLTLGFAEIERVYPGKPVYLQGESLGAGVALMASMRGGFPIQGLILNAPPVHVNLKIGPGMPNWMMRPALWGIALPGRVAPNMPMLPMQWDFFESWIWGKAIFGDVERDFLKKDPNFTHVAMPAIFATNLDDGSDTIRERAADVRHPLIVLQGDKDYLVSPASSTFLREHAGAGDKTFKLYPGMSHCTLHDKGKEEVWADIINWLDARLPNG